MGGSGWTNKLHSMKTLNYFDMKNIGYPKRATGPLAEGQILAACRKYTNFLKVYFLSTLSLITLMTGCKKKDLQDLAPLTSEPRVVSAQNIVASEITKDNSSVAVPFHIKLSGPAGKAFQVAVDVNYDTIARMITNGTLQNTVVAAAGSVFLPSVVNVSYGTDSATGTATIKLSELERNYGKNVAFMIRLTNPGKGNEIDPAKSTYLVVINTAELMGPDDLHTLSISNGGGGILNVEFQKNYTSNPGGVTIPLIISLANQASSAFELKIRLNTDTIDKLIAEHVLPSNTIQLNSSQFSIDTFVRIGSNLNSAIINLSIPWSVFDANIIANNYFAFYVSLAEPTRHILHPTKSNAVVLVNPSVNLDNNSYITGNGTGLKAEYFSNNQFLDFDGRAPDIVRIDETIDFQDHWKGSAISVENSSARWTGEFLAPVRGQYTFYQTRWDDGARLLIDGVAIIDDFTVEWDKPSRKATITLERGQRYKIEAQHRQNYGGEQVHLEYEVQGLISRRIVPKSQLFPAP